VSPDPVRRGAARAATLIAVPVAIVVGLLSFWILGGFDPRQERPTPTATPPRPQATSAVSAAARALAPPVAEVCRAVLANLPDAIREARRRPVTTGAEQNAAYGDPPLTLSCGTATPSVAATDRVWPMSGVCWFPRVELDRTVWTTVDREVPVTVTIPGPQDASAQWVIAFSAPVGAADARRARPPTGCR